MHAERKKLKQELRPIQQRLKEVKKELKSLNNQVKLACVKYRNDYVRPEIQAQFANGIRE
jgi:phosphopantetheine adenylyltransferase